MKAVKSHLLGATGARVPVIGQGTWHMELDKRPQAIAALRHGLDAGLGHIDTAEMYGSGAVEELVGEAITGRRDEVFLVSKVLPKNATRKGTRLACEASLRRLRTDHLDLYLLHWPGPHPLEETIAAFEELVAAGKIRHYGVSNFDVEDLEQAEAIAGKGRIACNQVLYHLQERAVESAVIPWCESHQVAVVAYSPFGSGHFPLPKSAGGRALQSIADAHKATPQQVALAFLLRHPSTFAIPKTADNDHVDENAAAASLHLSAAEIASVDHAFPSTEPRDGLPMI